MTHTVHFARDLKSSYVKFALATYRSAHHAFDKITHTYKHTLRQIEIGVRHRCLKCLKSKMLRCSAER